MIPEDLLDFTFEELFMLGKENGPVAYIFLVLSIREARDDGSLVFLRRVLSADSGDENCSSIRSNKPKFSSNTFSVFSTTMKPFPNK